MSKWNEAKSVAAAAASISACVAICFTGMTSCDARSVEAREKTKQLQLELEIIKAEQEATQ